MHKVFIDIETTGFSPIRDSILTIGMVDNYGNKKLVTLEYNKKYKWNKEAESIHGITREEAAKGSDEKIAIKQFSDFFRKNPGEIWAHCRNRFDFKFINIWTFIMSPIDSSSFYFKNKSFYKENSTIDLLKRAKKNSMYLDMRDNKLNTACDYFGIELDHHNAMSDAIGCMQVHDIVIKDLERKGIL